MVVGSFPYHCCYHVDSLRMARTLLQILPILLEMPEAFIAIIFHSMNQWAIPENIHTIPRTALRISEGEGGFTIMEF